MSYIIKTETGSKYVLRDLDTVLDQKHGNYLMHHGILGQKWGHRNGPPYPLKGGDYSRSEKVARTYKKTKRQFSDNNKKHFDNTLKKGTILSTLSYDKNRTKNASMFFATYTKADHDQYNALFNKKANKIMMKDLQKQYEDFNGYKFNIHNKVIKDMKIASEDSAIKCFKKLYTSDRDMYNFIVDEDRMLKHFLKDRYRFKGYREAKQSVQKIKEGNPSETDIDKAYRIFNFDLVSQGQTTRDAKDIEHQRKKFFKELQDEGYSGLLDTNDALYGGYHANSPIIVFDTSKFVLDKIGHETMKSKRISALRYTGKRIISRGII